MTNGQNLHLLQIVQQMQHVRLGLTLFGAV